MKFNRLIVFISMITISGCISLTYADYRDEVSARQAIQDLKDGALILRFYSKKKTIDEIDRLLTTDISESNKDRLRKKKKEVIDDRLKTYKRMHKVMNDKYSFSSVYFINDFDMLTFNESKNTYLLLNENMEKDSSISFDHEKYFYLAMEYDDFDFIILNQNGSRVAAPFPSRLNVEGFFYNDIFTTLFGQDKFVAAFGKLDKDLKVYYNSVVK